MTRHYTPHTRLQGAFSGDPSGHKSPEIPLGLGASHRTQSCAKLVPSPSSGGPASRRPPTSPGAPGTPSQPRTPVSGEINAGLDCKNKGVLSTLALPKNSCTDDHETRTPLMVGPRWRQSPHAGPTDCFLPNCRGPVCPQPLHLRLLPFSGLCATHCPQRGCQTQKTKHVDPATPGTYT